MMHNIRGFTLRSTDDLLSYLTDTDTTLNCTTHSRHLTYDIVFLQETWVKDLRQFAQIPFYFGHTPLTDVTIGRAHGGVAVFCSIDIVKRATLLHTSKHHLTLLIDGLTITSAYYPPSLTIEDLKEDLRDIPRSDILIGDLNIKIPSNNSNGPSNPLRRNVILDWCLEKGLEWIRPEYELNSDSSNWDHCFTRRHLTPRVALIKSGYTCNSDHLPIALTISPQGMATPTPTGPVPVHRPFLKKLKKPEVVQAMSLWYNVFSGNAKVGERLDTLMATAKLTLTCDGLAADIESVDRELHAIVKRAAYSVLGTYEVNRIKTTREAPPTPIQDSNSNTLAVMQFKRMHRGSVPPLTPMTAGGNVHAEGMAIFREIWSKDEECTFDSVAELDHVDPPFTEALLRRTILKYPASKSGGCDGLHGLLYKALIGSRFLGHLTKLFNLCYITGHTPGTWNEGLTPLIPKKLPSTSIKDTRPITLTLMRRRYFEIGLRSVVIGVDDAEEWTKLHGTQAGCRKGYSTLSHCAVADQLTRTGKALNILLDISKAFDSVPHQKLYECLQRRRTPPRMLKLFQSLYLTSMRTRLVINGVPSEEVKITRGIFQGSVFSPFLFEVYIDELAVSLHELCEPPIPRSLFFVDDILLQPRDFESARLMLSVCDDWSQRSECRFNPDKCFLLTNGKETDVLLIDGKPIQESKVQLYLGIPFDRHGIHWVEHMKGRLKKFDGMMNMMKRRGTMWPQWLRLLLMKTFARPQLDYAAPMLYAWSLNAQNKSAWTKMQTQVKEREEDAIRWCLDTTTSRPAIEHLYYLANVEPYTLRIRYLGNNSWKHLRTLHLENPWHSVKTILDRCSVQDNRCVITTLSKPLEDYKEFTEENATLPVQRKMGFKKWFQRKHRHRHHLKHRLSYYVFKECRSSAYGPDACLLIKDAVLRKKAVDWRRNMMYHDKRRKCLVCGDIFNRPHLNSCVTIENLPAHSRPPDLQRQLDNHRRYLEAESVLSDVQYNGNYTVLDCLLNLKDYEYFGVVCAWIEAELLVPMDALRGSLALIA